ncbi:MAG: hypothetical protein QW705_04315 [Zestosphaera sp.]
MPAGLKVASGGLEHVRKSIEGLGLKTGVGGAASQCLIYSKT